MGTPYLGEIRVISFNFAPKGWALCNGQLLPINQNQALFSILGTTYGGDGRVNFALPDLRGRAAMHAGNGFTLGERGGEEAHTLTISELPAHVHTPQADPGLPTLTSPAGNLWAKQSTNGYTTSLASPVAMSPQSISSAGGSQPHANLPPFGVLNFIIALQGVFPSRN
jgi:microcystin-dependent protein